MRSLAYVMARCDGSAARASCSAFSESKTLAKRLTQEREGCRLRLDKDMNESIKILLPSHSRLLAVCFFLVVMRAER